MSINSPADLARGASLRERHGEWPGSPEARLDGESQLAELSLSDLGRWLGRHAKALAIGALIGFVLCVGIALTRPRAYTSSASFLPQSNDNSAGRLMGLAAQFGVSLGNRSNQSPAFYVDILKSDELLGAVADGKYARAPGDSASLETIFDISGGTAAQRRQRVVRRLQSNLRVTSGRETGIVRIQLSAESPTLAQQLATRLLRTLNDFNLRLRQEQAVAERTFAKDRLDENMAELRAAEGRLQDFRRQNRIYASSPDLGAEFERLQREVSMRQQIYMSMAQAYEQARIDAVRSTPAISVVEHPSNPANPDSRGTLTAGVVGIILGMVGAVIVAWLRERRRGERAPAP